MTIKNFVVLLLAIISLMAVTSQELLSPQFNDFRTSTATSAASPVQSVTTPVATKTKCECAVFNTKTPSATDIPLISQAPISIGCDAAGHTKCLKLCTALAEAAKESGPVMLCSTLGHYNQLKASVFSRVCGAETWTWTGLTSPKEICCHEKQLIPCKEQEENPPKNQL